jgi:hypothetical protein
MHGAGGIKRLGGNRAWTIYIQRYGFLHGLHFQSNSHFPNGADGHLYIGTNLRKSLGIHDKVIRSGQKMLDTKFSAIVRRGFALKRRIRGLRHDSCQGNGGAAGVLHDAAERAAKFLRGSYQSPRAVQEKIETNDCVYLTNEPAHKEAANTRLKFKTRGRRLGLQRVGH